MVWNFLTPFLSDKPAYTVYAASLAFSVEDTAQVRFHGTIAYILLTVYSNLSTPGLYLSLVHRNFPSPAVCTSRPPICGINDQNLRPLNRTPRIVNADSLWAPVKFVNVFGLLELDVLCIMETWLNVDDSSSVSELLPLDCESFNLPRQSGHVGGFATKEFSLKFLNYWLQLCTTMTKSSWLVVLMCMFGVLMTQCHWNSSL